VRDRAPDPDHGDDGDDEKRGQRAGDQSAHCTNPEEAS
jgi:hypothetical protein